MAMSDRKPPLTRPAAALAAALSVALALALLPGRWVEPVQGVVRSGLRPGQAALLVVRQWGGPTVALVQSRGDLAARLAETQCALLRLEEENGRLAAELAEARSRAASRPGGSRHGSDDPLLVSRYVPARALGRLARDFLARRHLLDVGSRAGIEPDALVLDPRGGLIDRGGDAQLRAGQGVVAEGRVWGKIATVGPLTSTVQTVTERGYRDLVVIGQATGDEGPSAGPRGMLEGTGEPLARIRLVEVTWPVAVGDLVYSAAGSEVVPEPLLYGRVARVERPTGAAHWEIWMEPAAAGRHPDRVAVLRVELNPVRAAGAPMTRTTK